MIQIKQVILDVLKPHQPDIIEFAKNLAATGEDHQVNIRVIEIDEKTETLEVIIDGSSIELETIAECISTMGASLHSVDGVNVVNLPER